MSDERRPYRKTKRAELEARTRRRITESAVELHGTVGPAATTISALAEHAGVRRSTVYRHFPDEAALFEACSAHWRAANPAPDPSAWADVPGHGERTTTALSELYAFYARTERMYANLLRDEPFSEVLHEQLAGFRAYLAACRDVLLAGRGLRGRRRTRCAAAVGHALAFETWRSLVRTHGLEQEEAVRLMSGLVEAAAAPA